MKLKIVFTIFLLSIAVRLVQGQTASELFVKLPESTYLTLTVSDRLDLIDLYKDGRKATVKNRFGDSCSILRLTDDYLQVQTGSNTMELFLLPMINDSKIAGLIQTVCAPVCDSYLEFYTTSWKKLATSVFITLGGKYDFLKEGIYPEEEKVKNALIPLDISLMQLHYDPEKQELQQHYTTPDYLSETDRDKVKPYLTETPKLFKWNLIRFEIH
jgi:hypothetical protein